MKLFGRRKAEIGRIIIGSSSRNRFGFNFSFNCIVYAINKIGVGTELSRLFQCKARRGRGGGINKKLFSENTD